MDERIFYCFEYDKKENEIFIKQKELPVIESYLNCYHQIKNPVYDHVMVRSALSLIRKAINNALLISNKTDPSKLILNEADNKMMIKDDYEFLSELEKYLSKCLKKDQQIHYLPPYRYEHSSKLSEWLNMNPGEDFGLYQVLGC